MGNVGNTDTSRVRLEKVKAAVHAFPQLPLPLLLQRRKRAHWTRPTSHTTTTAIKIQRNLNNFDIWKREVTENNIRENKIKEPKIKIQLVTCL